jgi:hypothetical protein
MYRTYLSTTVGSARPAHAAACLRTQRAHRTASKKNTRIQRGLFVSIVVSVLITPSVARTAACGWLHAALPRQGMLVILLTTHNIARPQRQHTRMNFRLEGRGPGRGTLLPNTSTPAERGALLVVLPLLCL